MVMARPSGVTPVVDPRYPFTPGLISATQRSDWRASRSASLTLPWMTCTNMVTSSAWLRRTLPAVRTRRNSHNRLPNRSEDDDRAQHLAAVHLVERPLHVVETDRLGHELLQRQPTLQAAGDERRE